MTERRYRSRPATPTRGEHTEGPCWDARTGQLLWVDQYVGRVVLADWDSAARQLTPVRTYELGAPVGAVVPDANTDGWMVAVALGFGRLARSGDVRLLAQPESDTPVRMRMNDGKCDGAGRFWAGSIAFDKVPGAASLHRLDPDLSMTTVLRDVTISNGMAWTDDGATLYYIDTPTHRVDRFRVTADGGLADRTPAVVVEGGSPDGMCIDDEGGLWVAVWGAGEVRRYSPDGELLAAVEVDAPQVSSCCLGGTDGRTLFVTTSTEGYDERQRAAHPDAGRIFAVDVETPGRPAAAFGQPGLLTS